MKNLLITALLGLTMVLTHGQSINPQNAKFDEITPVITLTLDDEIGVFPDADAGDLSGFIGKEFKSVKVSYLQALILANMPPDNDTVYDDTALDGRVTALETAPDLVDDADNDPANELQNWTTLPGIPADIADGDNDTIYTLTTADILGLYPDLDTDGTDDVTAGGTTGQVPVSDGAGGVTWQNPVDNDTIYDDTTLNNALNAHITADLDTDDTNEIELPLNANDGDGVVYDTASGQWVAAPSTVVSYTIANVTTETASFTTGSDAKSLRLQVISGDATWAGETFELGEYREYTNPSGGLVTPISVTVNGSVRYEYAY